MVYTLIVEYEIRQTLVFARWLSKMKDAAAKAAIARRIARLEKGNFGDSKSVGGDKSTQDEDIRSAKEMAKEA